VNRIVPSPEFVHRQSASHWIGSTEPQALVVLPLATESRGNARGHTLAMSAGAKRHRQAGHLACRVPCAMARQGLASGRIDAVAVYVRRESPRLLDWHDNLGTALKAVIDGVADALGVRDDDSRLTVLVDQTKARRPCVTIAVYW
jgi:hypothetical protein